jgi:hypothetical protein
MLELLFEAGSVSNRAVLQSVFGRTPRGRAQAAHVRDINLALDALRGQTLVQMRLTSAGPSRHSMSIETDRCRMVLEVGRDGITVSSLEMG